MYKYHVCMKYVDFYNFENIYSVECNVNKKGKIYALIKAFNSLIENKDNVKKVVSVKIATLELTNYEMS